MTEVSPWTLVVAWIVIGLVVFWLAPRVPTWIGFALNLGIVAYGVVEIVRDGPHASEVTLVLVFGTLTALAWWRGHRGPNPPGP